MSAQPLSSLNIRAMQESDLDRVLEIEVSGYDFPWTSAIFSDCLRVGYHCVVLLECGDIIAYAIFSTAAGEAHLLNLCVQEEKRSMGHGGYLLKYVMATACECRCRDIFLEVRPSNPSALNLYQRFGFRSIGTRPSYYRALAGREDALVLTCALADDVRQSVFVPLSPKSSRVQH